MSKGEIALVAATLLVGWVVTGFVLNDRIADLNAVAVKDREAIKAAAQTLKETAAVRDELFGREAACQAKLAAMTRPPEPGSAAAMVGDLADGITRMGCLVERIEYRAELENQADLPHGWLVENVFGDRDKPDFTALTKLTIKQRRSLLKAFTETPYPTCKAE